MRPSGTGWNCPARRRTGAGAARRACWSGRWRIRGGGAAGCPPRWTSRTWLRAWTRSPAPWAGSPQRGGLTGWPPSSTQTPAVSPHRSLRWPSITACPFGPARRGAATARAWSRRPTMSRPSGSGAPCLTTSRPSRPSGSWTPGAPGVGMSGCARPRTARQASLPSQRASRCARRRRCRSRPPCRSPAPSPRRPWSVSAATVTASHPSSPGPLSWSAAGSAPATSTSPPLPGP